MPYYVIGIDPGQTNDPTALVLIEYERVQQRPYMLRGLHRFPLGTPYTEIPAALKPRLSEKPLAHNVILAIDATGVGAPVVDHLREQLGKIPIYAITITSGTSVTGKGKQQHVPKRDLINTTSVILEQRRLHIAANMRDTDALTDELLSYRRTQTDRGSDTYAAASGSHDDLVLALSLALWTAEHKPTPPRPYRNSNRLLLEQRIPGVDESLRRWNW